LGPNVREPKVESHVALASVRPERLRPSEATPHDSHETEGNLYGGRRLPMARAERPRRLWGGHLACPLCCLYGHVNF
jgi:hypothetical protein